MLTAKALLRRCIPGLLWFFVVVFPALVARDVTRADKALVASRVFGELTEPYLQAAPGALLVYSIAASFWSVPLLLFFAARAKESVEFTSGSSRARLGQACAVVVEWALAYLVGFAIVVAVASVRAESAGLVAGWGLRLGAIGLLTGLPGAGVVLLAVFSFRQRWLSI